MNVLKIIPVIISLIALAAHFFRAAWLPLTALYLILVALLFIRKPWSARIVQLFLILGSLEWIRTLLSLLQIRKLMSMPTTNLTIILISVALFTFLSAFLFQTKSLRKRYKLGLK